MGIRLSGGNTQNFQKGTLPIEAPYTSSLDAALSLCERVLEGWGVAALEAGERENADLESKLLESEQTWPAWAMSLLAFMRDERADYQHDDDIDLANDIIEHIKTVEQLANESHARALSAESKLEAAQKTIAFLHRRRGELAIERDNAVNQLLEWSKGDGPNQKLLEETAESAKPPQR